MIIHIINCCNTNVVSEFISITKILASTKGHYAACFVSNNNNNHVLQLNVKNIIKSGVTTLTVDRPIKKSNLLSFLLKEFDCADIHILQVYEYPHISIANSIKNKLNSLYKNVPPLKVYYRHIDLKGVILLKYFRFAQVLKADLSVFYSQWHVDNLKQYVKNPGNTIILPHIVNSKASSAQLYRHIPYNIEYSRIADANVVFIIHCHSINPADFESTFSAIKSISETHSGTVLFVFQGGDIKLISHYINKYNVCDSISFIDKSNCIESISHVFDCLIMIKDSYDNSDVKNIFTAQSFGKSFILKQSSSLPLQELNHMSGIVLSSKNKSFSSELCDAIASIASIPQDSRLKLVNSMINHFESTFIRNIKNTANQIYSI